MRYWINILFIVFATTACTKALTTKKGASYLPVKKSSVSGKLNWRGVVRSANRVEIRAERKVRVAKLLVKQFQPVKKGQPMVELDRSEAQQRANDLKDRSKTLTLELNSSRVKLDHTAKNLERKKTLLSKGIIAQKEYDDVFREYQLSQADYKGKELDQEKLRRDIAENAAQLGGSGYAAPMDGVVTGLMVLEQGMGDVNPGQLLAVVSDPSLLALWISVEENHLHRLSVGSKATITLDAQPGESYPGKIISIGAAAQQEARVRTFEVGIAFTPRGSNLSEGFTGDATYTYAERSDVLAIPVAALKYSDGKDFVLAATHDGGESTPRSITPGLKTDTEVEILAGLTENEYVVIDE